MKNCSLTAYNAIRFSANVCFFYRIKPGAAEVKVQHKSFQKVAERFWKLD